MPNTFETWSNVTFTIENLGRSPVLLLFEDEDELSTQQA